MQISIRNAFVRWWALAMLLQLGFCWWIAKQGGYTAVPVEVFGICQWIPGLLALAWSGFQVKRLWQMTWHGPVLGAVAASLLAAGVVWGCAQWAVVQNGASDLTGNGSFAYPLAHYLPSAWLDPSTFVWVLLALGPALHWMNAASEEWFWRGELVNHMQGTVPRPWIPLLTGLLWGLWHVPMVVLLDWAFPSKPWMGSLIFVVGLTLWGAALTILRLRTSGLLIPIAMHATFNAWMLGYFNLRVNQVEAWWASPWGPLGWAAAGLFLSWLHHVRPDAPAQVIRQQCQLPSSQYLTLPDGQTLHFVDEGPRDAPTLLLIHGFMASLRDFDACAQIWKEDWRVVRLDVPGMGLSGTARHGRVDAEYAAACATALLDHLQVPCATWVGHSRGGYVAWVAALMHPERVNGLALISAAGLPQGKEPARPPLSFKLASITALKPIVRHIAAPWLVRKTLQSLLAHSAVVDKSWVQRALRLSLYPGNRATMVKLRPFVHRVEWVGRLSEIHVPTLILWGADDDLIPVRHAHYFQMRMPGSKLKVYTGVGHYLVIESPSAVANDVASFFSSFEWSHHA